MRAMKDSGIPWIGEIPQGWKVCRIKDVAMLYNGNSIKDEEKDNYTNPENTYPYISTKDIDATYLSINYTNGLYTSKDDRTFKIAQKDSCLMCIEGGSAGKKKAYVEQDVSFVNKLCCFAPHKMDGKYLFYYLCSPTFESEFYKYISGLIGGVSVSTLKNFIQLLPPLADQQKIAEFLDRKCAEVDEMIALQEQIIEELKAYKQSVITEAVTKGLNPAAPMRDSGIEWIGSIPEHWEVKRLKQESIFINGFAFDSEEFKIDEGVRVIRIGDIGLKADFENCVRAITNPSILTPYRIENGDILIAMSGATTGKCCIVDEAEEAYINQRVGIIRSDIRKIIYYSLQTPYFMEFVNLNNAGSAQPNISSKAIGEFPILNIPLDEQYAIAEYLDCKCSEIDSLIQTKQSKIDSLKEYKKSIIYEYVTGKREVE